MTEARTVWRKRVALCAVILGEAGIPLLAGASCSSETGEPRVVESSADNLLSHDSDRRQPKTKTRAPRELASMEFAACANVEASTSLRYAVRPDLNLMVLAHASAPGRASDAVTLFEKYLRAHRGDLLKPTTANPKEDPTARVMSEGLRWLSGELHRQSSPAQRPQVGVTAVLLKPKVAVVVHAGLHQATLLRGGKPYEITFPHNLAELARTRPDLVREGVGIDGNADPVTTLTRAIGFEEDVEVDVAVAELENGDALLLATQRLAPLATTEARKQTSPAGLLGVPHAVVHHANAEKGVVLIAAESLKPRPPVRDASRCKVDNLRPLSTLRMPASFEFVPPGVEKARARP